MNIIQSMNELIAVALCGSSVNWKQFGNVHAVYNGDLVLFNYTAKAQYENTWNWFETVSRGLILNWKTGEIVARGFDKFFNWFERGRTSKGYIVSIAEKIDGSLGILYRDNGEYHIATRGSFTSEQALWATRFLNTWYDLDDLPQEWTLLFEIVYPENRIVVDYEGESALYLLAIRNRYTGEYLLFYPDVYGIAQVYHFPTPKTFAFNSVTDIMESTDYLDSNHEGYVALFSDGQRFKFKGDRYVELHRIVTGLSFKRVLQSVKEGTYNQLLDVLPDEFLPVVTEIREEIDAKVKEITDKVEHSYGLAPKKTRKAFAKWVMDVCPELSAYMFLKLDGCDYADKILEREF